MARPSTLYLLSYNSLQSLGWSSRLLPSPSLFPLRFTNLTSLFSCRALALARVLGSFFSDKTIHAAYVSAGDLICFLQTIAFVEVLHAAFGLVPSGVMLALMQWGGRTHFLLAIVRQIPEVQHRPSIFITFLAWSMSEAIRYPHYALSCIGISLSWLTYLRRWRFIMPSKCTCLQSEPSNAFNSCCTLLLSFCTPLDLLPVKCGLCTKHYHL